MSIDVEALKNSVDIVSVIGSYIRLKKRGSEYVGLCPFHADTDPSFYINPVKRIAHCFVCDETKDVIDFVQAMDGINFVQACEKLGAKTWEPRSPIQHERTAPPIERTTSKPPEDAAPPNFHIRGLGDPVTQYTIRSTDGSLIAYECRYEIEGRKEIRIWSWGARGDQPPGWAIGHCNVPRPLYGLERLNNDPKATILITEGPKKADAGKELLPKYASLSFTGGANAWHKHDYTPIAGRTVLIIPDCDAAGITAAEKLAAFLADARGTVCKVRIVDPTGQPEGWDIADALAEGWDTDRLIAWAKPRARDWGTPKQAPAAPVMPQDASPPLEAYAGERQSAPRRLDSLSPIVYVRMSDVKPEKTNWLWPGRIPRGEISILSGNPGLGKSQITSSIASIVTNGGSWPVDRTPAKRGSVIMLSAEDNTTKTMRPRLDAAGADCSRIIRLQAVRRDTNNGSEQILTGFNLAKDISELGGLIHEIGDVNLVVIDPISAYLGDIDSHNNAEVRGMLEPLQKIAEAYDTAILCVTHQNKSSGNDALLHVQGSIGFAAAARAVWGVTKDKENPQRRYFMALKNNLGEDKSGLAYSIEPYWIDAANPDEDKIPTSRVLWESEPVSVSSEEAFSKAPAFEEKGAVADAKLFLRSILSDGPIDSKQVESDARGAGHAMTTVRRAAAEIKVDIRKEGFAKGGAWKWSLR